MTLRTQQLAVLVFWLASMTWLVATKLMPMAPLNQPPDCRLVGPGTDRLAERVSWRIECEGQPVGKATTVIRRPRDGTPTVESDVSLRRFPMGRMLGKLVGTWSFLPRQVGLNHGDLELTVNVRTRMQFSQYGEMQLFQSWIDLDQFKELLHIRGTLIKNDQLQVIVSMSHDRPGMRPRSPSDGELLRQNFHIPAGTLIVDGFAPHPRLANLRVGQKWTMQSFRPFSLTNSLRQTRAEVLRQELAPWEREMESMFVVALDDVSPAGLTATQSASILLWVRDNGTVVRQQLRLGGVRIDFLRLPDDPQDPAEGRYDSI
jgi:hypothetical protein